MKLTEDMPDQEITSLVQIVGFLFRENPRQLKQFLNNLTSKYLLAKEREAGPSPQINPPITDKRLFLAKVVAIETRFPDIYSMFRTDDNLFLEVHSAAVTQSRAGEAKSLLNDDEPSALLENFLRTTGHITADNPKAFFHLNPNPPKDTDGRREESGRGGEGATGEIAWVPFGVGRSADRLHRRTGAPMAVCGSCDARDGERIRSRELSRTGLARVCGDLRLSGGWVADGAVRPGVEWLAAGPRRG